MEPSQQPKPLSETPSDEMARRLHESSPHREVYVVKGIVTDPSAYDDHDHVRTHSLEPPRVGDPEWRFFDVDPTALAVESVTAASADFLSLEDGLSHFSGAIIHYIDAPQEDVTLYERWESFVQRPGSVFDRLSNVRDAAYEQGILGSLMDALDQMDATR
jgi:hypothetical protein